VLTAWLLLIACRPTVLEETGGTPHDSADSGSVDTSPPEDIDADGYDDTVDCDDFDPAVHPGAVELWNGIDDDCDGRSDADGTYDGSASVRFAAVYEGQPWSSRRDCPTTLVRIGNSIDLTITCKPATDDELGLILMGDSITIEERDNVANTTTWSGETTVSSADGWSSAGSGDALWSGFDRVTGAVRMNTFSLDFDGTFEVNR
jgi:hypothetical protein